MPVRLNDPADNNEDHREQADDNLANIGSSQQRLNNRENHTSIIRRLNAVIDPYKFEAYFRPGVLAVAIAPRMFVSAWTFCSL